MSQFQEGFYRWGNLEYGQAIQIVRRTKCYVWARTFWRWEEDDTFDKRRITTIQGNEKANLDTCKHASFNYAKSLIPLTDEELAEFKKAMH